MDRYLRVPLSDIFNEQHVILDPSRVAAQVASGIGFIGAGTIIFRREVVKGLTTAASIWAVAAVGLAVGGGMFLAAVSATLLALALLVLAKPLNARLLPNRKEARRVRLVVERGTPLAELREEIEASEVPLERKTRAVASTASIQPSAWKGCSPKLNFRFTEFSEVQLSGAGSIAA